MSEQCYFVSWEVDIYAETPIEAAQKALAIQRDPNSMATVFQVTDEAGETTTVDLEEAHEQQN